MNFLDLGLSKKTVNAIEDLGIYEPTTIQTEVIPAVLRGDDVFAIAPRGCGKTASYVLPLIDIIVEKKENQNILIITPNQQHSNMVSDRLALFNKYHEVSDCDNEATVIIATLELLVEMIENDKLDLSVTNILIVDDINFIKVNKKLSLLEKVLDQLPEDKQNIVFTNRKAKDTDQILAKILKTPLEIKVDKTKVHEADNIASVEKDTKVVTEKPKKHTQQFYCDQRAYELAGKNNTFKGRAPNFIFNKGVLASEN